MYICTVYIDNETGSEVTKATDDDTVLETTQSKNNEKHSKTYDKHTKLLVILVGVFFVTSVIVITTTVSVILAYKLCSLKRRRILMVCTYIAVSAV